MSRTHLPPARIHACRARGRVASAFTLLEVLVALAIFALAAVVLGAAYINVLNSYAAASRASRYDEDVRFARSQLVAEADRDKAEEGAEFESNGGRRVRWTAEIAPTGVADLFTVTFVCELNESGGGKDQTVRETFRLLRPTWSIASERETLRNDARNRILEVQGQTRRTQR